MVTDIHRSIWLPIGRANFFSSSATANRWLEEVDVDNGGETRLGVHATRSPMRGLVRSQRIDNDDYTPKLQAPVLRRLLEVLPISFGYDIHGDCVFDIDNPHDGSAPIRRPTKVTMTLRPTADALRTEPGRRATERLVSLNVDAVTLTVDEDGFYTLRAAADDALEAEVRAALDVHLAELFGGDFQSQWQMEDIAHGELREAETPPPEQVAPKNRRGRGRKRTTTIVRGSSSRRTRSAAQYEAPAMTYNGLPDITTPGRFPPCGILTFFQLNTLLEGLFNDALTPAIFFEQRKDVIEFLHDRDEDGDIDRDDRRAAGPPKMVVCIADIVRELRSDADATQPGGRMKTLEHFLTATSRESLLKLTWSIESVRRQLLEEMMGILHRQSTLVQLHLDKAGKREWMPELATGANESQLRGYVMLVGTKLPLIANVHRHIKAAVASIESFVATSDEEDLSARVADAAEDLQYRAKEWKGLVRALKDSVKGLEKSVEHAWMERLLYEQEQSRGEQEAMAEIERNRGARLASRAAGGDPAGRVGATYNMAMLYFTIFAAVTAMIQIKDFDFSEPLKDQLVKLWWIPAIVLVFSLFPWADRLVRWVKANLMGGHAVGYEFAFRLDLMADDDLVHDHITAVADKDLEAEDTAFARQIECPELEDLQVERQGGARVEYVSTDSTLVKIHLAIKFRTRRDRPMWNPYGWRKRPARFEVINVLMVRKSADGQSVYLRETRVFGDSPRRLSPDEVMGLLTFVLERAALVFQEETHPTRKRTAAQILYYADRIFKTGIAGAAAGIPAQPADPVQPSSLPGQQRSESAGRQDRTADQIPD